MLNVLAVAGVEAVTSSTPWMFWMGLIIGIVGLFMIVLPMLRGFWMRFRMAMQRRKAVKAARKDLFLRSRLADVARGGREGEEAEVDVLQRRVSELKQDFIDGTSRLANTGAGAGDRPWFLLLGSGGTGRSTLMAASDLDLIDAGTPDGTDHRLQWWFHPNGTVLDPVGDVLDPKWGNRGAAEYRELLKWIRKDRHAPEVQGIVLAIEAKTLLLDDQPLQAALSVYRTMLVDTARVLGLDLPVYMLVTKCDEVSGLLSVMDTLSDGTQSRQMVGWSSTSETGAPFDAEAMDQGLDALSRRMAYVAESLLSRTDIRTATDPTTSFRRSASMFGVADRMSKLSAGLATSCGALFGEVSSLHGCHLRGVYFTAATQHDHGPEQHSVGRFIRDVFVEKIFRESTLSMVGSVRYRKIYLSIVSAIVAVYAVMLAWGMGTINQRESLGETAQHMDLQWSTVQNDLLLGHVSQSPLVGKVDGTWTLLDDQPMGGGGGTRAEYLSRMADAAYTPIPLPPAYRLASPSAGTLGNDLFRTQRRLAYRSIFNPMVMGPLVAATQDTMLHGDRAWTAQATQAWAALLQLEQAHVNLAEDWDYTFRLGQIPATDLLHFVLHDSGSQSDETQRLQSFAAGAGLDHLLPDYSTMALVNSLNVAGSGSALSGESVVAGLNAYAHAWNTLDYRATLPLGQAEAAIAAIADFDAAMADLKRLAGSIEMYTHQPPSEAQAAAAVSQWTAAWNRAEQAIATFDRTTKALDLKPNETLASMVQRATVDGRVAVNQQFTMLLERTVVLGGAESSRGGMLMHSVRDGLERLQTRVVQANVQIAKDTLLKAQQYDRTVWVKPKPPKKSTGAQSAALPALVSSVPLFRPKLEADILARINARMTDHPTGSVDEFEQTVSAQAIASTTLNAAITDAMHQLGDEKDERQFGKTVSMMAAMANWNAMFWAIANTIDTLPQTADQIGQQVASQVSQAQAWFRPGIPLTRTPDSGEFDATYNPVVANTVVAPWKAVRAKIDAVKTPTHVVADAARGAQLQDATSAKMPEISMLGQPQLNARYREREAALSGYVQQYLEYWARAVQASGQMDSVPTWEHYRTQLATVRPFQINSALLGYLQQVRLALEVDFLADTSAEAAAAKAQALAVQTQIAQLTTITTSTADAAILRWQALPESATAARAYLLGLTVKQFSSRYFFMYLPGSKESVAFWNNLTMAGLESLSNSISHGAQTAIAEVAGTAFRWPVLEGNSREGALTQAQVDDLARRIGRFYTGLRASTDGSATQPGATGAAAPKPENTTLLAGGTTGDRGVDYELARLRDGLLPSQGLAQGNVEAMQPARTPAQRVGNVVMALASFPKPLHAQIIQPPVERTLMVPTMPTAQEWPVNGAMQYRYVEIWVEGKQVGPRVATMRSDGEQLVRKEIQVPAGAHSLELRFFRGVDDTQPGPVVQWSGAWALVSAYLNPQTVSDEKTGIAWIPVTFDNDYELECYWWMGVKLDRPLPQVAQWPTQSSWPDNLLYESAPAEGAGDAPASPPAKKAG